MDDGTVVLWIALIISSCQLTDSILSWDQLAKCPKPLNSWYTWLSATLVFQFALCQFNRLGKFVIHNKKRKLMESLQFVVWFFIFQYLPVGYIWQITAWTENPESIPLRLKITFITMTFLLTQMIVPTIQFAIWTFLKMSYYYAAIKQKGIMRLKLNQMVGELYSPGCNFQEISETLTNEFFEIPQKDIEINQIKNKFSKIVEKDETYKTGCSICYCSFKKDELMTSLPICQHNYHYECIELWLRSQTQCPICKAKIRKNQLEYFHGEFEIKGDIKVNEKIDKELINEISINVMNSKSSQKLTEAFSVEKESSL